MRPLFISVCLMTACSSAPSDHGPGAAGNGFSAAAGMGTGTGGDGNSAGASVGGAASSGAGNTSGMTGSSGRSGAAGAPMVGPAGEYFISPDGNDGNPGTEAAPYKTFSRAFQLARAGVTFWVMPGTFVQAVTINLQTSGAEGSPIKLWATEGARPVLDFSTQPRGTNSRGFVVSGNYWHVRGLEVKNAGDNGMLISGSNNTIENMAFHGNGDTGLQITVSEAAATNNSFGANNLVLNCDSYENIDVPTGGENADGFAAKLRIGPGNVFRGCRAWNNADDGWDMFAADDVVVVENCWAFSNGKAVSGTNPGGDGNGFKLGGEPAGVGQGHAPHRVSGCAAFENRACGFTRNNNAQSPALTDCAVRDNPRGDYCDDLADCTPERSETTTAAQAKAMARGADGSLPQLP